MQLTPIAYCHNGFHDKFGIPRQSREDSQILTRIRLTDEYRTPDALRGIEGYSHLWLIWGFHDIHEQTHWKATVRPPRLGGNTRMGVFATRSPYRPNPLGLTSVKLVRIEGLDLIVSGADMMDGTPIYDIKPYLSFSDSHPDALNGFAEGPKDYRLEVDMGPLADLNEPLRTELMELLSQDPRPAYQDDPERIYQLDYAGQHVSFRVADNRIIVVNPSLSTLNSKL